MSAALDPTETSAHPDREHDRTHLHASVSGMAGDSFFVGFSENISEGGIFVATWSPPEVGAVVEVSISVPGSEGFVVKGEVRWHRTNRFREPTGCGIEFRKLDPNSLERLRTVMLSIRQSPKLLAPA